MIGYPLVVEINYGLLAVDREKACLPVGFPCGPTACPVIEHAMQLIKLRANAKPRAGPAPTMIAVSRVCTSVWSGFLIAE